MLGGIITNPYLLGECVCSGDVSSVSAVCAAIGVYGVTPYRWVARHLLVRKGVESITGRRGEPGVGPASFDQAAPVAVASRPGGASPLERGAGPGCGAQADARLGARGFGKSTLLGKWAEERAGGGCPSPGSPWTRETTIRLASSLTSSPRSRG